MSDTPRTDAALLLDQRNYTGNNTVNCSRQLERELNAAQASIRQQQLLDEEIMRLRERVKLLEEAGDKMLLKLRYMDEMVSESGYDANIGPEWQCWRKAKEAKP